MSHDPQSPSDAADRDPYADDDHDPFDDDGEDMEFDCPRFWVPDAFDGKGGWYCPAQGSEDCDWECPHS